ncbi:hypothetical protein GGR54DRAFT_624804 [Hypoxylon sp. NC1633]|nr:hypothetical protein GGR54DRAFT_624804 [Hypoxylon sp. NC1633]
MTNQRSKFPMRQRLSNLFKPSSRHASSSASQSSSTTVTEWPQGLDVVYNDPEARLNIIAIHGLNGY